MYKITGGTANNCNPTTAINNKKYKPINLIKLFPPKFLIVLFIVIF